MLQYRPTYMRAHICACLSTDFNIKERVCLVIFDKLKCILWKIFTYYKFMGLQVLTYSLFLYTF